MIYASIYEYNVFWFPHFPRGVLICAVVEVLFPLVGRRIYKSAPTHTSHLTSSILQLHLGPQPTPHITMPPRIPTQEDFASIATSLPHIIHFPSSPESTTAILILLHGLGDTHMPFASFARAVNLPGVLAISVRGTSPLPAGLGAPSGGSHWGDDLALDSSTGDVDADPGFKKAGKIIMEKLVHGVLVDKCGWEVDDVMFFGYGQGGSLALGMASTLLEQAAVEDVTDGTTAAAKKGFKGIVSIGGPAPPSMVSSRSARGKSKTPVLMVQVDDGDVDYARREFEVVTQVKWRRQEVGMPSNRDEMLPIMKFFADRLRMDQ